MVFCEVVPIIALVPFTGAATDRLGAYRIFRAAQTSGAGVMAALAIVTALDAMTIELLLALTVLNGVNMAFMQPSYFALVANLVPREALSSAVLALQSSMVQTGALRRPGDRRRAAAVAGRGGGVRGQRRLLSRHGGGAARDRLSRSGADCGRRRRASSATWPRGLRYIAGHETIRTLLLMTVAFSVLLRPVVELLPAFAAEVFGRGADGLATLLSSAGAGAILGSLVLARRGRTQGLTRLLGASGLLCGIAVAGFASTGAFWLGIVLMAVLRAVVQHQLDLQPDS